MSEVVVSPEGGDDSRESLFLETALPSSYANAKGNGAGSEEGRGGEDSDHGYGEGGDGGARAAMERGQTSFFKEVRRKKKKKKNNRAYTPGTHICVSCFILSSDNAHCD